MTSPERSFPDSELSKLLYEAREGLSMLADIVDSQTGKTDRYTRSLVERIDAYREGRGWCSTGFGGEDD